MQMLTNIVLIVQILSAVVMIGLVLIQHGKGADMGASFGSGASGSLFGATGSANFLSRSTAVCAGVFFICTLALAFVSGGGGKVRGSGETDVVVKRQLSAVIHTLAHCAGEMVVAYEPVWAIGTGRTASPEQAQAVHAVLRTQLRAATAHADRMKILYGGSVKADNARSLFAQPDVDGGLIGGASLKADDFIAICRAAG